MLSCSESSGGTTASKRWKPYNVECKIQELSNEAIDWISEYPCDLVWVNHNWRIWQSPAEDHELGIQEYTRRQICSAKGIEWDRPIRKRSIDVVRFASKRDALYFKLIFL